MVAVTTSLRSGIALSVGARFTYKGLLWTVEERDHMEGRYTLTAANNCTPLPGLHRWSFGFVSHILTTGEASREVVERCEYCLEPLGDPLVAERCEVVHWDRHLTMHIGCGEAFAHERGQSLDDVLA